MRGVRFDLGVEQLTYVVERDEGFVLHGLVMDDLYDLGFFVDAPKLS